MEPIPIQELKSEKCVRISAEDLIELCELAGPAASRSPSKKTTRARPKILIIDIRSPEEYPFYELFCVPVHFIMYSSMMLCVRSLKDKMCFHAMV